ncbi:glycoside hydrolase [Microdochium bolleyi]|uniref:Mannan endo-1,6-alpha-mannosidase n=1 Tax=Microdochium bolleyi TaxID=196109 RepID=A0A136J1Z9_9PEZI|nr:glycoside hydrolase [Microdochium bolleyi]
MKHSSSPSSWSAALLQLTSIFQGSAQQPTPADAIDIDVDNQTSVSAAAAQIAQGFYTTYHNASSTAGHFNQPEPWFWWLSGSGWNALLDFMVYNTAGDAEDNERYRTGLFAAYSENLGPRNDFAPPEQKNWEANDDQMYWAVTSLYNGQPDHPNCTDTPPSWLEISTNAFEAFARRWRADSDTCGGGLRWQFRPGAPGYDYKNAVTNGGFFQVASRLARFTGNETYAAWADAVYGWSAAVGLVSVESDGDDDFIHVFDGTSDGEMRNCSGVNHVEWSYNIATYMHGAANMYAYHVLHKGNETAGLKMWERRSQSFVAGAAEAFFTPTGRGSGTTGPAAVMYEQECEQTPGGCSTDQTSFKSSLGRWMGKTALLVPSVRASVVGLLRGSARAAAASCQRGSGEAPLVCGQSWTRGDFDGRSDFGAHLSALEVVQSLLVLDAPPLLVQSRSAQV